MKTLLHGAPSGENLHRVIFHRQIFLRNVEDIQGRKMRISRRPDQDFNPEPDFSNVQKYLFLFSNKYSTGTHINVVQLYIFIEIWKQTKQKNKQTTACAAIYKLYRFDSTWKAWRSEAGSLFFFFFFFPKMQDSFKADEWTEQDVQLLEDMPCKAQKKACTHFTSSHTHKHTHTLLWRLESDIKIIMNCPN